MEDIVISYFSELFSSSNPTGIGEVLASIPSLITDDMNMQLSRDVDSSEVLMALKQMHRSKAPGPDGFSPGFYQHFWAVVGEDVVAAVKSFLLSDYSMRKINSTHVTLIPKTKDPKTMGDLRPISLCNVLYKLGSKVLANRLKVILPSVISPFQSAFVQGRLISDNSLVAFEVVHFLKKRRSGKKGYGALKLDMSKAYDRVEWAFVEGVMLKMGFSQGWINLVMRCVRTVTYSFIIDGEARGRVS